MGSPIQFPRTASRSIWANTVVPAAALLVVSQATATTNGSAPASPSLANCRDDETIAIATTIDGEAQTCSGVQLRNGPIIAPAHCLGAYWGVERHEHQGWRSDSVRLEVGNPGRLNRIRIHEIVLYDDNRPFDLAVIIAAPDGDLRWPESAAARPFGCNGELVAEQPLPAFVPGRRVHLGPGPGQSGLPIYARSDAGLRTVCAMLTGEQTVSGDDDEYAYTYVSPFNAWIQMVLSPERRERCPQHSSVSVTVADSIGEHTVPVRVCPQEDGLPATAIDDARLTAALLRSAAVVANLGASSARHTCPP